MASQVAGRAARFGQSGPRCRSNTWRIGGASQLGTCTPLVMWPIGTRSSGDAWVERCPHRARHLAVQRRHRVGRARELQRQHRHAEGLVAVDGLTRPEAHEPSRSRPSASRSGPRCSSISSAVNRSCPAGTGVCVVNTTCCDTRRTPRRRRCLRLPSAGGRAPAPQTRCVLRSGAPRRARCRAPRARARRRRRAAAPGGCGRRGRRRTGVTVSSRSSGRLPSTSESSSSSVLRPTASFQTRAAIGPVRVSMRDAHRLAVAASPRCDRQHRAVDVEVLLLLPAVAIEPLPEVALVVVEADADERDAEVGRALM